MARRSHIMILGGLELAENNRPLQSKARFSKGASLLHPRARGPVSADGSADSSADSSDRAAGAAAAPPTPRQACPMTFE